MDTHIHHTLSISKLYHACQVEKQEIKKWKQGRVSSGAENKEIPVCQNFKQYTRHSIWGSIVYSITMTKMEKDISIL